MNSLLETISQRHQRLFFAISSTKYSYFFREKITVTMEKRSKKIFVKYNV